MEIARSRTGFSETGAEPRPPRRRHARVRVQPAARQDLQPGPADRQRRADLPFCFLIVGSTLQKRCRMKSRTTENLSNHAGSGAYGATVSEAVARSQNPCGAGGPGPGGMTPCGGAGVAAGPAGQPCRPRVITIVGGGRPGVPLLGGRGVRIKKFTAIYARALMLHSLLTPGSAFLG